MRLIRLHLKHFRQHGNTAIDFQPGLTGIIGSNGAGKTSLIEAIAFALYGTKAIRGRVDDLKTRGARKNLQAEAHLTFEHAGQVFRVERSTSDAKLFLGGEADPCSQGTREVSDRVTALLGMSYDEYVATFFTEQKGLEFLSGKKGATERERFIVRMMGYDKLERIQEMLRVDRRDKRNHLSGLEAALGTREEIENQIKREEAELNPVKEKYEESARVLANAEKELQSAESAVNSMEGRRALYLKQQQLNQEAASSLNLLGVRLTELHVEIAELEKQIAGAGGADGYAQRLEETESALSEISSKVMHCESRVNEERLRWKEEVAAARAELQLRSDELLEFDRKLQKMISLGSHDACPTCEQELGESFQGVVDRHKEEARQASQKLLALRQRVEEMEKEPKQITETEALLARLKEQRHSLQRDLGTLSELRSVAERIAFLQKDKEKVENVSQLARQELDKLTATLNSIQFEPDVYDKACVHRESCRRLLEVARLQRVKAEGDLTTKEQLLKRSRNALVEHDEKAALLNAGKRELVVLEESDKVLSDFRRSLNSMLRPRLAELASEFLSELTDGRYSAVEIAHDFTPSVLEDGEAKAIISGGEEDLLNLCLRLALSQLLAERAGQSFSLLILDEVFGSLDQSRRTNVLILLEKLNVRFDQILVITHLDDIREGVQNLLSVDYDESTGEVAVMDEFLMGDSPLAANI
ncbi:MAG: AAA family ATPase [Deltaproteobacteria bacterium]|nr:AAA family ATPase [Deltaproteobacteria bacterium]